MVATALLLYAIRPLLPPLVIAVLLAYVLNPLVRFLTRITRISRTKAVVLIYLFFLLLLALALAIPAPNLARQIRAINIDLQDTSQAILNLIAQRRHLDFFGFSIDLVTVYQQVQGPLERIFSGVASGAFGLVRGFASTLIWLVVILVLSFYILKDADKIGRYCHSIIPPLYRQEVWLLGKEINQIWNDFLRGQLVLCLVVGLVVGTVLGIIGVPNALVLGILAGVLEFIPSLGPALAATPAVLIAFFQGSSYLPLPNFWFAILVIILYMVIQQVENNFLVPRILGGSLNLHPVVVLVGIIAGAQLAGILGIFLAAPVLASARVIIRYAYQKVLDLESVEEVTEVEEGETTPAVLTTQREALSAQSNAETPHFNEEGRGPTDF
ncbi:MAG: AI-2E family transporter [Anaerolineae bacterium]